MHIPSIARGKRFVLPRPLGSADALLLAQHAQQRKAAGQAVRGLVVAATCGVLTSAVVTLAFEQLFYVRLP